jgi:hypothetical protein
VNYPSLFPYNLDGISSSSSNAAKTPFWDGQPIYFQIELGAGNGGWGLWTLRILVFSRKAWFTRKWLSAPDEQPRCG